MNCVYISRVILKYSNISDDVTYDIYFFTLNR